MRASLASSITGMWKSRRVYKTKLNDGSEEQDPSYITTLSRY